MQHQPDHHDGVTRLGQIWISKLSEVSLGNFDSYRNEGGETSSKRPDGKAHRVELWSSSTSDTRRNKLI